MLLLPATVTASEASDTRRLLLQAMKAETQADVVVDASNLRDFDSSALALLLECHRAASAWGKPFSLRNPPPSLVALAHLYGVEALLMPVAPDPPAASAPSIE